MTRAIVRGLTTIIIIIIILGISGTMERPDDRRQFHLGQQLYSRLGLAWQLLTEGDLQPDCEDLAT